MPRRFVYLDTEAWRHRQPGREVQTLRLAVACFEDWDHRAKLPRAPEWGGFADAEALWRWVSDRARGSYRTVLVAHNLAYDLRLSSAFVALPALGWTCERVRLDHGSAFARWRRGRASLVMVDLYSWAPAPLEEVGRWVGASKPELPDDDDAWLTWAARCVADVNIVRAAWRRAVDWLETTDLGTWQATGAGQAWAAWRHKFLTARVLVGLDDETRAAERESAWTGRCEAWRHGPLPGGPWVEWDYRLAYASVGRELELPVRPIGPARPADLRRILRLARSVAYLCRVRVSTAVPCIPAMVNGRIAWPVGRFESTLWEHEVRLAVDEGATVDVVWARPYMRRPLLRAFMMWATSIVDCDGPERDDLVAAVVKQWTRALVGRFGMRYRRWDPVGSADRDDCLLLPGVDTTTGESYRLLWTGRDILREGELTDFEDGSPAVMAYVMAECRVRLWRAMRTAQLDHVAYVDTDSLVVDEDGDRRLHEAVAAGELAGLRRKGVYRALEVIGPRQLVANGQLRAAGVPKRALRTGDREWSAQVWRGLGESLKRREADRVVIADRVVRLRGTDNRRQHLDGGLTAPFELPGEFLSPATPKPARAARPITSRAPRRAVAASPVAVL